MPAGLAPAWSPLPTPPPPPPNSLLKRDVAGVGLCGFKNGTFAWTCSAFSTCMWNTDISAVGCCRTGKCDFYTSCIDSTTLGGCGRACSADTLNLLCTDSVMQYCAPATFDGDYFSYSCVPSLMYWWTIMLTSQGQTAAPSGIPRFTGSKGLATASSSSFPASNSPSPQPNSKNTGAIAGGAVGGLAVLCLFILALVFLILRYKRPLRVAPPAVANGRPSMFNPISTPAELSASPVRAE